MPIAPIKGRYYHTSILSGSRLIIWGGMGPRQRPLKDGAIYDIKKGEWKKMARAPIKARSNHFSFLLEGNQDAGE